MTGYPSITTRHHDSKFAYTQRGVSSAHLYEDFGMRLVEKWFPGMVDDSFPTYKKGKHKGMPKGYVAWRKIEKGGWFHGRVVRAGQCVDRSLYRGGQLIANEHDIAASRRTRGSSQTHTSKYKRGSNHDES
jgi:hypothetical protein